MDDERNRARIKANIDKMLKGGASDDEIDAYILSEENVPVSPDEKRHEEFRSGRLGRRMERLNTNDQEQAAATPSLTDQIRGRVGGALASVPEILPGSERAIAGLRTLGGGSYEENLRDVRSAKEDSGPVANTLAASLPMIASMGASGAPVAFGRTLPAAVSRGGALASRFAQLNPGKAAMAYGAARGALNSTPVTGPEGEGWGARAVGTAMDAALMGTGAKAIEYGSVLAKGLAAKPALANVKQRFRDAAKMAKPLYDKFRALGDLGDSAAFRNLFGGVDPVTGEVSEGLPVIRTVIRQIKGESPELRELPDTHSRVIDAVRKRLGKKAWQAANGVETGDAVKALDRAVAEAVVGQDATLAEPVRVYSEGMKKGEAVARGSNVMKYAKKPDAEVTKHSLEYGEEGFKQWMSDPKTTPEQIALAREGIKGRIGARPIRNLRQGARMLREAGEPLIPSRIIQGLNRDLSGVGANAMNNAMGGGHMGLDLDVGSAQGQVRGVLAEPVVGPARPGGPFPPKQLPAMTPGTAANARFNAPAGLLVPGEPFPARMPAQTPLGADRTLGAGQVPRQIPAQAGWSASDPTPPPTPAGLLGPGEPFPTRMPAQTPMPANRLLQAGPTMTPTATDGPLAGPAIPNLGPEEQLKEAIRMAQESRLSSGAATKPVDLREFLARRQELEGVTENDKTRRLINALKEINSFRR